MPKEIDILKFLELKDQLPAYDVRTPKEYKEGHIPGVRNLPLFTNDERAEVGTIYKQDGKEKAVYRGLEIVGPKMTTYLDQVFEQEKAGELLFHCWRGGMRSNSLAWLLEKTGKKTHTLSGGYKAYRRHQLESFNQKANIIILGGMTGSGKTELLHLLRNKGEQVIDLEKLAHHKGSSFGTIGETAQPSTEHFSNLIFEQWRTFDLNKSIWIEDESHLVGTCYIPEELWFQMREAPVIKLEVPFENRIKRLIKYYTVDDKRSLIEATRRIQKRLGREQVKEAVKLIENDDFESAAAIILHYYDKTYLHGLSKRKDQNVFPLSFNKTSGDKLNQVLGLRDEIEKNSL